MWSECFSPHLPHVWHPLQASLWCLGVLAFETPQGCWDIRFNLLKTIADPHLHGSMGMIKFQDVGVGLDLFFPFLMFDVCRFLFSKCCCHLFCCNQGQLPTSDNSFGCVSCGYVLHLEIWKLFIFKMFYVSLRLSTLTSSFPFLVFCFFVLFFILFLHFLEQFQLIILFQLEKRENFPRQTSSKDSMTMNLGKSAALFSSSDLDKFRFVFCQKTP